MGFMAESCGNGSRARASPCCRPTLFVMTTLALASEPAVSEALTRGQISVCLFEGEPIPEAQALGSPGGLRAATP